MFSSDIILIFFYVFLIIFQDLKEKLNKGEEIRKELEEKIDMQESEVKGQKEDALKRDKAIQGLVVAYHEKEKEVENLTMYPLNPYAAGC